MNLLQAVAYVCSYQGATAAFVRNIVSRHRMNQIQRSLYNLHQVGDHLFVFCLYVCRQNYSVVTLWLKGCCGSGNTNPSFIGEREIGVVNNMFLLFSIFRDWVLYQFIPNLSVTTWPDTMKLCRPMGIVLQRESQAFWVNPWCIFLLWRTLNAWHFYLNFCHYSAAINQRTNRMLSFVCEANTTTSPRVNFEGQKKRHPSQQHTN